jgi:hypothetical protein
LLSKLSEFMKLSEIAITDVLGNCQDERTFFNLAFVKNKVRNRLSGHLAATMKLYSPGYYTFESFSFAEAYAHWRKLRERLGGNL